MMSLLYINFFTLKAKKKTILEIKNQLMISTYIYCYDHLVYGL